MKVSLNNVTKKFEDAGHQLTVLNEVNFEFPAGKSIAIVGPSGVGKSTLLNILGGLERPSSGSVKIGATSLAFLNEERLAEFRGKNIGFVFQFHHLLAEFSAIENVAMPLLIAGESESVAHGRAFELLDRIGLADRIDHRPGQLSGGEQQRVSVARAVIARPPLILADEPTGNLDAATAASIRDILTELHKEHNSTLVIVTHSIELAKSLDLCLEMLPGGELIARK